MINIDDRVLDELNESEIYLCLQIARYMKASRMTAWPSIETLAERCKWDERTVKRWRKSLEEKGFLDVTRTPGKPPTYQFKKSGFGVFHPLESVEPKAENGGSFFVPPAQNEGVQNLSLEGVQNLSLEGVQNLSPEVVSKREVVSNGEVVSSSTADAAAHAEIQSKKSKSKKLAAPAAPKSDSEPKYNWTREAAKAFDEVASEQCQANGIEYSPFNWRVCSERNFGHLKNLRVEAILPDLIAKRKQEGMCVQNISEVDILKSIRRIFTEAWLFYYKKAQFAGGKMKYTPERIYIDYNEIKSQIIQRRENATNQRNTSTGYAPTAFNQGVGNIDKALGF